jgi:riboflavin-specific deaminase-like protein
MTILAPAALLLSRLTVYGRLSRMASKSKNGNLPFVFVNVLTSADGKLAPASRRFVPFGGEADKELLMCLRTQADAVMSGARTVDLDEVDLGPGDLKYRRMRLKNGLAEYNIRVVGTLNPEAAIFKHRFSPIIVLTTKRAGKRRIDALRKVADDVRVCAGKEIDFRSEFRWLKKKYGVSRLLCEGGGEINEALFRQGLVDELYLTIAPVIFGGHHAPTLADGPGIEKIVDACRMTLKSMKRQGEDLFLVYTRNSRSSSAADSEGRSRIKKS